MTNDTKRQISKEIVKILEKYPDLNWNGLIEEIKLMCEERKGDIIHEMA